MNSTEKTLISLAAGIVIGAGLGILFAPQKGSDTRKRIRKEFDRCCDQFEDAVDTLGDIIEEKKAEFTRRDKGEQEA